jgi:2-oxo-4-hydroxy-4-carboxy--5-ureidoimidazoline (OHCU) decarboxylase
MRLPRLACILSLTTLLAAAQAATKSAEAPQEAAPRKVLVPDAREEFVKNHPEFKEQFEKIKAMTPEERHTFFKEHPELREKLMEGGKPAAPTTNKRAEFLKDHPELKEELEKLKAMSPEERQAWLKDHPELREKLMQRAGVNVPSPEKRAEFLKDHPELKEQFEKLKAMSPEERQAWIKEHPEAAEKIKEAMRAMGGNPTPVQNDKLRDKSKDLLDRLSPEDREKIQKRRAEQK